MDINYYYIIDIIFFLIIINSLKFAYKKKIYIKIFEYIKLFTIITLSAKGSYYTGTFLQQFYITKVDTYSTLILLSFILNFLLMTYLTTLIGQMTNKYAKSMKTKDLIAKGFTFIEVIVLFTFGLYLVMQLYVSKMYIEPYLNRSFSYKYIKRFYKNFLNDEFVHMVLDSDTGTNYHEVIFKSLKNSI
jgi:hypothetical protein